MKDGPDPLERAAELARSGATYVSDRVLGAAAVEASVVVVDVTLDDPRR